MNTPVYSELPILKLSKILANQNMVKRQGCVIWICGVIL